MNPFAAAMARMKALMARQQEPEPEPGWADTVVIPPPAPPSPAVEAPVTAPAAPAEPPLLTTRRRAIWRSPEIPGPNGVPYRNFTPVEVLAEAEGWAMLIVQGDTRPCVQPSAELLPTS
jgi:hypothetical protein